MKIYGTFNYAGIPTGWYPEDVFEPQANGDRNAKIPATAIGVDPEAYIELRDAGGTKAYVRGEVVDYVPPPPGPDPIPEMLTRRQFLLALYNYSVDAYNRIVNFVHNHDYPPIAIEFDNALYFYRYSNTLMAVAADPELDFTDEQIDAVFIAGGKITD